MNKNVMIKSLALSTLLMSAIGGSAFAEKAETAPAPAAKPQAITLAKPTFGNPLQLAKQYAPDTVKDWEAVLTRYDQLRGLPANLTPIDLVLPEAGGDPQSLQAAVPSGGFLEAGKTEWVPAAAAANLPLEASLVPEKGNTVLAVRATAPVDLTKDISITQLLQSGALDLSVSEALPEGIAVQLNASALLAVHESGLTTPSFTSVKSELFAAQGKLADAEAAKDATAIRTALTELLEQYKQEIAVMEAAGN